MCEGQETIILENQLMGVLFSMSTVLVLFNQEKIHSKMAAYDSCDVQM